MTNEEKRYKREDYSGRSFMQLARELLRLLLLLIWKFLFWLIKKFLKGVLWCIQTAENGWERLNDWWHDNDTQAKVAKTRAWLRFAARTLGKWCVLAGKHLWRGTILCGTIAWKGIKIAARATWRGAIVAIRATVEGIIHLRPTLKRLAQLTVAGGKATWAWVKRCRRGMRLSHIRRKRAYERFRRNGGVKGMMINTSQSIRNGIQMFMEEDQEEAAPDAVTEDDLMAEAWEKKANEGQTSVKIGRSFLSKAKDFMDVE